MNRTAFASLTILCFLSILSIMGPTQVVKADYATIYVRTDGSIDPPIAPISSVDNITYTFTGSITYPAYNGIVVQRNNIVIDGNRYTIQGFNQSGTGLSLNRVNNVTIKNTNIEDFQVGIYVYGSNNNLDGNNITNNVNGIHLYSSQNNTISMNNITTNSFAGILLEYSYSSNIVSRNVFISDGLNVWDSWDNVVVDNVVNGKPLIYLENVSNYSISGDAGQVVLVNCNRIKMDNLTLSHTTCGADLWNTTNTSISGCTISNNIYGVRLDDSSTNSISGNDITANYYQGIFLDSSSNNTISENNITANNDDGIVFMDLMEPSCFNIVSGNNIAENGNYGIYLSSANNWIYQNNFVNNTHQACSLLIPTNVWDSGYPRGNYWSDYNGTDLHNGLFQNVSGSDGVGDSPYVIGGDNKDYYPLMGRFSDSNVAQGVDIQVVSNSTVSDLEFNRTAILFNVSGVNATMGFCNVCVPSALLNGTLKVLVNGTQIQFSLLPVSNSTNSYLYFTYSHSTEQIIIMPELPSFPILPLFLITTLLAIIYEKRGYRRRAR